MIIPFTSNIQNKAVLLALEHPRTDYEGNEANQKANGVGADIWRNSVHQQRTHQANDMIQGIKLDNQAQMAGQDVLGIEDGRGVHPQHGNDLP